MKLSMFALCLALPLMAAEGMIDVPSDFNVSQTADRVAGSALLKGMTVFKRVYHSEAAAKVGVELRPTVLIIFGNPKAGSPLMACSQTVAIDLPQKALVWEDEKGKVWISYNDPKYLQKRHNISGCDAVLEKIEKALDEIAKEAATN